MLNQPEGNFKLTMIGNSKSGNNIKKESEMYLSPFESPEIQESIQFSVIYEFNESKSVEIYEKYLSEIVAPKIQPNTIVTITGHTDTIGEENYNKNLSFARANDVKVILENKINSLGIKDVKFVVYGEGEDEKSAHFDNKYPEERFYNRTVIIDIIK